MWLGLAGSECGDRGRGQGVEGLCAALEGCGRVSSLRLAGREICIFE